MSELRPECTTSNKPRTFGDAAATWKIYDAVRKRRSLGFGKLDTDDGKHCAMGCFWEDNPRSVVSSKLIDEIAAVNDSVPPTAKPSERRKHVLRWLEWKLGLALALVLSFGLVRAEGLTPLYVPMGIFYLNGEFVKTVQVGEPINDLHECMEKLQHVVGSLEQNGKIPEHGGVIGACMPVPAKH